MLISYRNVVAMVVMLAVALMTRSSAFGQAADIYKSKCAVCHGADGKGDTAVGKKMGVKSFSDPEVAKHTDQNWIDVTKKGEGKMPSYEGKLTDEQIKELVKYMRSLK